MTYAYLDEAQTIGGIISGTHTVVVEPGHPRWAEFVASSPEPYMPPPGPTAEQMLAEAKADAREHLTAVISAARTAMITDLPGQDMIYLAKETEARAWVAAEDPDMADYPLLSAEVGITAPDADALAQLWLNLATLWRAAAALLEAVRMAVGGAIEAAETVDDVEAALAPLSEIGSP